MKYKEHEINQKDNFIMGWYMEDTSFCDEVLNVFENATNKEPGRSGVGLDKSIKDSIDVTIDPESIDRIHYGTVLKQCADLYYEKYKWSACCGYALNQQFNIQYYPPNGGYKMWHSERGSAEMPYVSRHLVWMTYLNDVTDGGGTEFYHQNIIIPARKGLTLIWPVDWTFVHRGQISPTQEKTIVTGWFNLI